MAEQVFVDSALVEDVAEGEEVFVGSALFSEDAAGGGGGSIIPILMQLLGF